jgi:hypothetical protein
LGQKSPFCGGVGNTRWRLYCAPYCSCRWSLKWWCIIADCIWDELSPLFTLRHSLAVIHMQKSVCRSVKQISGTWPGLEIRSSEQDSTDKEIHTGSPPGATRSPRPGSQRQSWRNYDWSTVRLNVTLNMIDFVSIILLTWWNPEMWTGNDTARTELWLGNPNRKYRSGNLWVEKLIE